MITSSQTRRLFFRDTFIRVTATTGIIVLASCGLVSTLDLVSAALQAALPLLGIAVPGAAVWLPLVGTFLNILTTAIDGTATVLEQKLPPVQQAAAIEKLWATAILSPTVLAQLPNTPISKDNPNTPAQLITALIGAANAFLNAIASNAGLSTASSSSNVLVSLTGLTASVKSAVAKKRLVLSPVDLRDRYQLSRVHRRCAAAKAKLLASGYAH
jgi:hypothetical protein